MKTLGKVRPVFMVNDFDAYIPEIWAQESLMVLEKNLVMAMLVHRDFSNEIARFGDVVNTRRPSTFTAKRKTKTDTVSVQDASATNVPVSLNQHLHTSFIVADEDLSKSFKDLSAEYLVPAIRSIAQKIDEILFMQSYQFIGNGVGKLGTDATVNTIVDLRTKLNEQLVPLDGRNIVMPPAIEGQLLKIEQFTSAEKIGDAGTAIREASLGRRMGFDLYMGQNCPSVASGSTTVTGAANGTAAVGATTMTVDGFTGALTSGSWFTVAGEMTPHKIRTHTETSGDTTSITFWPALASAVANDAVITVYSPGAINFASGYAAGYAGATALAVNGFTVAPKTGQLISFDTDADALDHYGALATPTTTALDVDRALVSALTHTQVCGVGPAGNYGLGFHRNAIALVSRALATPPAGIGARSAVANYNGLGLRVTISYEGRNQGILVTVDILCGVKVLDTNLGALLYA